MSKRRSDYLVLGIIVLIIGIILVLRVLGISIPIFFKGWWTLFLIVPGIVSIVKNGVKFSNAAVTALGILLFIRSRHWLWMGASLIWKIIVPVCLIGVGVVIIKDYLKNKN